MQFGGLKLSTTGPHTAWSRGRYSQDSIRPSCISRSSWAPGRRALRGVGVLPSLLLQGIAAQAVAAWTGALRLGTHVLPQAFGLHPPRKPHCISPQRR
jgi:hypothetical protein